MNDRMTAVAKLLPCPFCGGEPDVLVIERHAHGPIAGFMPDYDDGQFIECGCGIAMAIAPDKDAAEAWNRRAAFSPAELGGVESVEMSPEFTDTARAALLWVLWHHQGANSPVGQPIRFALGMGQFDELNNYHILQAKHWAAIANASTPRAAEAVTEENSNGT